MPAPDVARRIRRIAPVLIALAALFALWVAWGAWRVHTAGALAGDAGHRLERMLDTTNAARFIDPSLAENLRKASDDLDRAHARLGAFGLAPFRVVPVLGRQLRSASALTAAAPPVARDAASTADAARRITTAQSGPARTAALDGMAVAVDRLQARVRDVDLGPRGTLVSSLASARAKADEAVARLDQRLSEARAALTALRRIYTGPSTVLVLGANNAEMRAGHGALLSWGIADVRQGQAVFRDGMQPIGKFPRASDVPPAAPDLATHWGWLDLRNVAQLGTSARFDVTADRTLDLYEAATAERPALVVVVDSFAFDKMADIFGGIALVADPHRPVLDPEDVLSYLLRTQYEDILVPGGEPNSVRRDRLGDLAEAMLPRLVDLDGDSAGLIDTLEELMAGRHLMLYSDAPALEAGWRTLGASGEITGDGLSVAVTNAGANKLDQFLSLDVAVRHTESASKADVVVDVTVRSAVPEGEPPYILGRLPVDGEGKGAYAGLMTFTVPGDAEGLAVDGAATYAALGVDGPTRIAAVRFDLRPGEERRFTARFRMPSGRTLRMIPPARWPTVRWKLDDYDGNADRPKAIQL